MLRRWLSRTGYDVTFIANVTDIDDKILAKSAEARPSVVRPSPTGTSARCTRRYDALGCLPPTYEPRATGHIPEMLELIASLIERATPTSRRTAPATSTSTCGPGRRTASCPASGSTTWSRPQDADPRGKRDPRDFALWKGHKPSRAGDRVLADAVGSRPARAGTSSARRWPASTSATSSTSTAAASTCASRTTRTSWPSRRRPAGRSRGTGCTTRWSPRPARR